MSEQRGKLIVAEGRDGTGKSTQAKLLAERMRAAGRSVVEVHEPGSTQMGLELRRILLDANLGRVAATSLLMFTAARVDLWEKVINPALSAGDDVVADRNWLSSAAYQGYADDMGIDFVRQQTGMYLPEEYVYPALTVLLTMADEACQARLGQRGGTEGDTFESRHNDFMSKVGKGYLEAAGMLPRIVCIDADASVEAVHESVWREVEPVLTGAG